MKLEDIYCFFYGVDSCVSPNKRFSTNSDINTIKNNNISYIREINNKVKNKVKKKLNIKN